MTDIAECIQRSLKNLNHAASALKSQLNTPATAKGFLPTKLRSICWELREVELATPQQSAPKNTLNKTPGNETNKIVERWWIYSKSSNSDKCTGQDFTPLEERQLCWIPSVVQDVTFQHRLYSSPHVVEQAYITALMHSYHAGYDTMKDDSNFNDFMLRGLAAAAPHCPRCNLWHRHANQLIGSRAYELFAAALYHQGSALGEKLRELGFSGTPSAFTSLVSGAAVELLLVDKLPPDESAFNALLKCYLFSSYLPEDRRKDCISSLILSRALALRPDLQRALTQQLTVNYTLGDPRHHTERWLGIDVAARDTAARWLAAEDICYFFGKVSRDREDRYGRKSFWLPYAARVKRTRMFCCAADQLHLKELRKRGLEPGRAEEGTSVLVMDFGTVVVVELSDPTDGCFLYPPELFLELLPNFGIESYQKETLRAVAKHSTQQIHTIPHDRQGRWTSVVAKILAPYFSDRS